MDFRVWSRASLLPGTASSKPTTNPQGRSDVQGCRDIASLNPACNAADSLTSLPRSKPGWQSCQSHSPPSCKGTRMVCFIESNLALRAAVRVSLPGACPSNAFMILATLESAAPHRFKTRCSLRDTSCSPTSIRCCLHGRRGIAQMCRNNTRLSRNAHLLEQKCLWGTKKFNNNK